MHRFAAAQSNDAPESITRQEWFARGGVHCYVDRADPYDCLQAYAMLMDWGAYAAPGSYDELVAPNGVPRAAARALMRCFSELDEDDIGLRQRAADLAIRSMGITFTVYHEEGGSIDRAWPLDVVPRTISRSEWLRIDAGLRQRVKALNLFIDDVYHGQRIVAEGVLPAALIASSSNFRRECVGANPAFGCWAHICGTDLVRDQDGTVYVLEDNLRVPSGVSYMIENRQVIKRVFPEVFDSAAILPVDDYPSRLHELLTAVSPRPDRYAEIVVLTPGVHNSAYFEHAYLARQMGCELVEGRDLAVFDDDCVYMQTVQGWTRVDVIYRRIDDEFLDPEVFRADSMLGVRGLMRAWGKGNVALVNAPGAGVADDKLIYTYVPEMIRYYLGEDPILPNVPSWRCGEAQHLDYVLNHMAELVIKTIDGSGGYGMLVGPSAARSERAQFATALKRSPRQYIAQPLIALSTVPTFTGRTLEPRRVDLRPFILSGPQTYVTMGGLTRVAMREGSFVVNSSQGGGSKDTWVVDTGG